MPLAPEEKKRFNSQGLIVSIITTTLAFLVGGLVVLATGHDPFETYRAILHGTGITWLIPGYGDRAAAATNFQQTLLETTPLILCGLAVAFAFRCGMFNIGGQGQYFAGSYAALIVGSYVGGHPGPGAHRPLHRARHRCRSRLGRDRRLPQSDDRRARGDLDDHAQLDRDLDRHVLLRSPGAVRQLAATTRSRTTIVDNVHLPVFWGDPVLQGLHIGFFIAIGALVVFWAILNRTTLGFEVRAVGFNPEAARYSGINVKRNYFLAMAISGAFAGLGGRHRHARLAVPASRRPTSSSPRSASSGSRSRCSAATARSASFFAALLFGALTVGTSSRQLDPSVFDPELAGNLTLIIQGLVVLFVGADLLVLAIWKSRKKLRLRAARRPTRDRRPDHDRERAQHWSEWARRSTSPWSGSSSGWSPAGSRCRR